MQTTLDDERIGERPTVSALCLGGLIKHVASVEERWQRFTVEGSSAFHYDLSATHPLPEAPWHEPGEVHSVRRVLALVVAETAHHAGHADLLREALDGRTPG